MKVRREKGRGVAASALFRSIGNAPMLGYGDVAITLSGYQAVLPDKQESAARVMEEVPS